jgi:hypothetical protein
LAGKVVPASRLLDAVINVDPEYDALRFQAIIHRLGVG